MSKCASRTLRREAIKKPLPSLNLKKNKKPKTTKYFRDVTSSQITCFVTTTDLLTDLTSHYITEDSLSIPLSGLFSESCKNEKSTQK